MARRTFLRPTRAGESSSPARSAPSILGRIPSTGMPGFPMIPTRRLFEFPGQRKHNTEEQAHDTSAGVERLAVRLRGLDGTCAGVDHLKTFRFFPVFHSGRHPRGKSFVEE